MTFISVSPPTLTGLTLRALKEAVLLTLTRGVDNVVLTFSGPDTVWPDFVRCIQALASVFDTFSTEPLDRQKVRENFFKRKK